jgi:hypothetical protein
LTHFESNLLGQQLRDALSSFGRFICYFDCSFKRFLHVLPEKLKDNAAISSQSLASKAFTIRHSFLLVGFKAGYFETLRARKNSHETLVFERATGSLRV